MAFYLSHVEFESRHAIRDLVPCDEFRRYTIKDTVPNPATYVVQVAIAKKSTAPILVRKSIHEALLVLPVYSRST
jgi:hypothetical protein